MIHPLLRLLVTRPHLLANHAEAYADLFGEELGKTTDAWKHRVVFGVVGLGLAIMAVVLGGVALMLWAVTPAGDLRAPWVLIGTPVVPALFAVWCVFEAKRTPPPPFVDLKQQVAADLAMLREVSEP